MNQDSKRHNRRPAWLVLICIVLILISLWGWLRLEQAIYRWNALIEAGVFPGPFYLAISGGVIGIAALAAGWSVWRRLKFAPPLALSILAGWILWLWVDRIWVARSPTALDNAVFLAAVSIIILGGSTLVMCRGKGQFR